MEKRLSMGKTKVICRECQTVADIENLDLETMRKFECSGCGAVLTDAQMVLLKLQYFSNMFAMFHVTLSDPSRLGGKEYPFEIQFDFEPHYEDEE